VCSSDLTDNIVLSHGIGKNQSTATDSKSVNGSKTTDNCDAAHNFKELETAINKVQMEFYNKNVNPKITKLMVKISKNAGIYLQEWDFTISTSTDGKAWVGFTSRGSCGNGYIQRADDQYFGLGTPGQAVGSPCYKKTLEKCLQDGASAGDVELITVYLNDTDQFKQYFVQFTKTTMPAK
jgi:hypothetical protein